MSPLLLVCFAASGLADAMFGIALIRQFSFSFGSGAVALCIGYGAAIASFAAGAFYAGPLSVRLKQPTQGFASLHAAAGATIAIAVAAIALFRWFAPLALAPIFLIGAESPVFISTLVSRRLTSDRLARIAGFAFACKLAGAAVGCLVCGFAALPLLGFWGPIAIAALTHLAIAAALAKSAHIFVQPELGPAVPSAHLNRIVIAVVALTGFCVTLSAAVWTRSLAPAAGTSLWSYTSIAAVFCFALAGGFALSGWQAPKVQYPGLTVALVGLLAGAFSIGGLFALPLVPRWYVLMLRAADESSVLFHAGTMTIWAAALAPAALLFGAAFPLAMRCLEGETRASEIIGQYTFAAASAGWIGAIVAGSLLVPIVGLKNALFIAVAAACVIAMLGAAWLTAWTPRQRIAVAAAPVLLAAGAIFAAPDWDHHPFASGAFAGARSISINGPETHFQVLQRTRFELYEEGVGSTVAVNVVGSRRLLWVDGRLEEDAGGVQPLPVEVPMLTSRQIRDVFVAGVGSGQIAETIAQRASGRVDVAEREIGMIDAARAVTPALFSNERVHLAREDPRAALTAAGNASYDLIIAASVAPWTLSSAKLSTREFYSIARSRLRPGGILAQRISIVRLDFGAIQSLLRTFTAVFPETLVLTAGRNSPELILIGSDQPLRLDWEAMQKTGRDRPTAGTLISRILYGPSEARDIAANAPENTDQNGIVEFSSLKNLSTDMSAVNANRLYAQATDPWNFINGAPPIADRKAALREMANGAIVTNDIQRALKYASDLRTAGDEYDGDRLTANVLYMLDRRQEAVALWTKCVEKNPEDARVLRSLIDYYKLLTPSQRPGRYNEWKQVLAKSDR